MKNRATKSELSPHHQTLTAWVWGWFGDAVTHLCADMELSVSVVFNLNHSKESAKVEGGGLGGDQILVHQHLAGAYYV
jgi:hypothetical protein